MTIHIYRKFAGVVATPRSYYQCFAVVNFEVCPKSMQPFGVHCELMAWPVIESFTAHALALPGDYSMD